MQLSSSTTSSGMGGSISPGTKALLNDLYQQVNTAYVGQMDTNTGGLQGGIEQIAASLQHLATVEVKMDVA